MLNTRDFLLYAIIFLFLVTGATVTGILKRETVPQAQFGATETTNVAKAELRTPDTAARIETLQAKLASGGGAVPSAPPVFKSLDQLRAELAAKEAIEQVKITKEQAKTAAAPKYCSSLSGSVYWSGVSRVAVVSDTVTLFKTTYAPAATATGTPTISEKTLLTLPRRSVRTPFDTCIDNNVIGVTVAGTPLLNTSAGTHMYASAGTVIGYTRDGFPVYGPLQNDDSLDTCGGVQTASGYRYHIRKSSPAVISCFAGVPADIRLQI